MSDTERRLGADTSGDRFWAGLALPGVVWLCIFFLLPFYVILCVALGSVDPIFQTPSPEWNPLNWNTSAFEFVFEGLFTSGAAFQTVFVRTFVYVVDCDGAVAAHRVPGGVLRRPLRRSLEGTAAHRPDRAVLHLVPHADAGLDQPAPGRRLGERRARLARDPRRAAKLARRTRVFGDPGARLRIRAVHDPAAVRIPRPDRPEPARSGARPRCKPVPGVSHGHPAALDAGDPRGDRDHRAADVRRLLHARPALGRATDESASATRSTSTSAAASRYRWAPRSWSC